MEVPMCDNPIWKLFSWTHFSVLLCETRFTSNALNVAWTSTPYLCLWLDWVLSNRPVRCEVDQMNSSSDVQTTERQIKRPCFIERLEICGFFLNFNLATFLSFSNCLAGEDGQIKIWSKSGMLRSTLVSQGKIRPLLYLTIFN